MSASDVVTIAKPAADVVVDIGEQARLAARRRERIMSIASPVGLLLAWEIAAQFGMIDVRFFPAPSTIMAALFRMAQSGELLEHVLISMQRITLGFFLGGEQKQIRSQLQQIQRFQFDGAICLALPLVHPDCQAVGHQVALSERPDFGFVQAVARD